jgi:elongation factor Ts
MVSALDIKLLREKTGAGMMDCKKALMEAKGDFEVAIDWLRSKGLSSAAKKSDRVTAEGLTGVRIADNDGIAIEVNSETDFVGRNEQFQNLVTNIGELALKHKHNDIESLKADKLPNGKTVSEEIAENIARIGENLNLRRVSYIGIKEGVIGSYVHNKVADGLGKISVLVGLESKGDKAKLENIGKQIAMHIAALKPQSLDIESLDPSIIKRERDIFVEQAKSSGKPDNIVEKMVEGRIRKFFEEAVLLEQTFVIDNETKISTLLANVSKDLGHEVKVTNFIRYELGEGIAVEESSFVDEVAKIAK